MDKVYARIDKESDCLQAVKTSLSKINAPASKSTRSKINLKEDEMMTDSNAQIGYGEATAGSMEKFSPKILIDNKNSSEEDVSMKKRLLKE